MNPLRYRAEILCAGSRRGACALVRKAKDLVKWLRSYNKNVVARKRFFAHY